MSTIRTIARPAPEVCVCGATMQPGLRYGPTPTPAPVLVCWTCAAERPPLACCRPGLPATYPEQALCEQCGGPLSRLQQGNGFRFCSRPCYGQSKVVERRTITCPCGVLFRQHQANRPSTYCSRACCTRYRPNDGGRAWRERENARRSA